MKKLFWLSIYLLFFCSLSNAQSKFGKDLSLKPFAGAKGIIFAIQSPNPIDFHVAKPRAMLMFRYLITDKWSLRAGVSYWKQKQTYSGLVFGGGTQEKFEGDTTHYGFNLGIQKSFGYHEKLEPYVAADFIFSFGQAKYKDHYTTVNASATGDPSAQNGDFVYIDGFDQPIHTYGVMGVAGVNYYLVENFAIGGEIGWSITKEVWGRFRETVKTQNGTDDTSTQDKTTFTRIGNSIIRITFSAFF